MRTTETASAAAAGPARPVPVAHMIYGLIVFHLLALRHSLNSKIFCPPTFDTCLMDSCLMYAPHHVYYVSAVACVCAFVGFARVCLGSAACRPHSAFGIVGKPLPHNHTRARIPAAFAPHRSRRVCVCCDTLCDTRWRFRDTSGSLQEKPHTTTIIIAHARTLSIRTSMASTSTQYTAHTHTPIVAAIATVHAHPYTTRVPPTIHALRAARTLATSRALAFASPPPPPPPSSHIAPLR